MKEKKERKVGIYWLLKWQNETSNFLKVEMESIKGRCNKDFGIRTNI
jgi:hypothetical protein